MLNVEEALKLVLEQAKPLKTTTTVLSDALGRVLGEPITSDIDSPPHDKSVVDGYAVLAADTAQPPVELAVVEEVTAGAMPTRAVERGTATRIMTGAPIPVGADAVVMVEQTESKDTRVRILSSARSGQNIMRRASSLVRGQTILEPGKLLRPIEIGLLAEVGRSKVATILQPRVAFLSTGNELVSPAVVPSPGQIRNSNSYLLQGLIRQTGAVASDLGIARDDLEELTSKIKTGLDSDILVLSGGVSAGVLDLVPQVSAKLGVREIFHKVNLKPGKPLWFGVKEHRRGQGTTQSIESVRSHAERGNETYETPVFGLPGNPVSSLVCFELFVRPAIRKMRGLDATGLKRGSATLTGDHQQRGDRPTYWPAVIEGEQVTPLSWKGSGDLRTLTDANCLAFFPAGERLFRAGEEVEALLLE